MTSQSPRPPGRGEGGELTNRQIVLRRRPRGLLEPADTELVVSAVPEPAEGEALVHVTYVGIDAAARTWLNDQPGYLPPVGLGEVIRAAGIGEVVQSRCDAYGVGDVVTTSTTASMRASTPSTGCSPGPTSERCWCG